MRSLYLFPGIPNLLAEDRGEDHFNVLCGASVAGGLTGGHVIRNHLVLQAVFQRGRAGDSGAEGHQSSLILPTSLFSDVDRYRS